jgi:hypothetical protein
MDLNNLTFVELKAEVEELDKKLEDVERRYVIVRTYSAGVHAGILKSRDGKEVVLTNSRRLWYWKGAASLSQLSVDGVSKPDECKFPAAVDEILLTEAIEIIPCTLKARKSIEKVKEWKA